MPSTAHWAQHSHDLRLGSWHTRTCRSQSQAGDPLPLLSISAPLGQHGILVSIVLRLHSSQQVDLPGRLTNVSQSWRLFSQRQLWPVPPLKSQKLQQTSRAALWCACWASSSPDLRGSRLAQHAHSAVANGPCQWQGTKVQCPLLAAQTLQQCSTSTAPCHLCGTLCSRHAVPICILIMHAW